MDWKNSKIKWMYNNVNFRKKLVKLQEILYLDSKNKILLACIFAFVFIGVLLPILIIWFVFPLDKIVDSKKKLYLFVVFSIVLIILIFNITLPKTEIAYIRNDVTLDTFHNKKISYKILDKVEIVKKDNNFWYIYKNGGKIAKISKNDVIFENTLEFKEAQKVKLKRDTELLKAEKEKEAQMAKIKKELELIQQKELKNLEDKINKTFYKVDINQFSDDGNGVYDFYISPIIWSQLPFDKKEILFKNCVYYVQFKTKVADPKFAYLGTIIKSSSDASVLAKYTVFKGIELK